MMDFPDHPFWDFSLALYGRPGVADACLRLQDACDLDVNLLLFGCWWGASGGDRLSPEDWRRLIDGTDAWRRRVVEPLRGVRRHLKNLDAPPQAAPLRKQVMAIELASEHAEQLVIAALAGAPRPGDARAPDVLANLEGYAAAAGVELPERARADLALIAERAVPGAKI